MVALCNVTGADVGSGWVKVTCVGGRLRHPHLMLGIAFL